MYRMENISEQGEDVAPKRLHDNSSVFYDAA